MTITKYILTAVDYGDTCDGKARVLGAFSSVEGAMEFMKNDIDDMMKRTTSESARFSYGGMCVYDDLYDDFRCEWNIEPIKITLDK